MKMCLNWKVIAGLALIGLGVWVVAPKLIGAALPLLLVAACPLSMVFMMRGMQGSQCASQPEQTRQPAGSGRTREEQLAELRTQLAGVQNEQEAIARTIAQLGGADAPAVREAEAIARTAGQRAQGQP